VFYVASITETQQGTYSTNIPASVFRAITILKGIWGVVFAGGPE
jgi:hypothetical protein